MRLRDGMAVLRLEARVKRRNWEVGTELYIFQEPTTLVDQFFQFEEFFVTELSIITIVFLLLGQ
jgi:hypothetical protein